MAFTKITAAGIGSTETVTLDGLSVINNGSFGGNLTVGGVLTYEDVTNVDSVGLITARNGIVVGSGITLSKDGDIFAIGITTISENLKVGTGVTISPDGDVFFTGIATGNGSGLTNLSVNTDLVNDTTPQLGGDLASNGNDINVAANDRVVFGTDKLRVKHTDSNADIENTTGNIVIKNDSSSTSEQIILQAKGGEDSIKAVADGAVELYHDDSKKLETTSGGVTVTGTVTDSKGDVRSIPLNSQSSAYTLVAADAGKVVYISSGGVTIPSSVMSAGDAVTIINDSGSDQTITQGSGLSLYNAADASSGNRTLAGRGMATVYFPATATAYISGAGLS